MTAGMNILIHSQTFSAFSLSPIQGNSYWCGKVRVARLIFSVLLTHSKKNLSKIFFPFFEPFYITLVPYKFHFKRMSPRSRRRCFFHIFMQNTIECNYLPICDSSFIYFACYCATREIYLHVGTNGFSNCLAVYLHVGTNGFSNCLEIINCQNFTKKQECS